MALSFLKTGADSAKLAKQAEAEAEQKKEQQGKLFRFYLDKKKKEEARITFIDGDLNPEGFLIPPRWYEHNLYLNGKWFNFFVCPERTNPDAKDPCPIDESGDTPYLATGFTIIDHRQFIGKNDKVYANQRRLLIAKPQSFELLNKLAVKRGGLAGCTFDVSCIGDKAASIGSMFDFVEKKSIEDLQKLYLREHTDPKTNQKSMITYFIPANFEEEIVYRTGDQLRALGLGKPTAGSSTVTPAGNPVDYSTQL